MIEFSQDPPGSLPVDRFLQNVDFVRTGFPMAVFMLTLLQTVGLGLFLALSAVFWSAVCIVVSGTVWFDAWSGWWEWYTNLPWWADL